jgi:hypothetical protein
MFDEFGERILTGHSFHFFRMRELMFRQRADSRAQDFAVQAVLSAKVVVYRSLVHSGLGNNSTDASILVSVICKQMVRGFQNAFTRNLGRSGHSPPLFFK